MKWLDNEDRERIREKQDKLLELAKSRNIPLETYLTSEISGAPQLKEMELAIFPGFEECIDEMIAFLKISEAM